MNDTEKMIIDDLRYIREKVDKLSTDVTKLKVKMAVVAGGCGLAASGLFAAGKALLVLLLA